VYQCLEPLAVVGLKQMGKLVHNHIILDPLRKVGQLAADANGRAVQLQDPRLRSWFVEYWMLFQVRFP